MASFKFKNSKHNNGNGGKASIAFGVFWTLFSSIFVCVGLWLAFSGVKQSSWPSTSCEIKQFEATSSVRSEPPFQIATRYTYRWEGQKYTGTKVWSQKKGEKHYSDLTELLDSHRPHQTTECFVNPDDPSEAVLYKESDSIWGGLAFALFGGCFMAIGIGMIIASARSKKKTALSSKADKDAKAGKFIIIPFFGIFACAGIAILFFFVMPMWSKYLAAKSWEETPATVIWSTVRSHRGDDSTTYSADIFYQYRFNGKTYKSNNYGLMGGSSSGRKGKQAKVRAHPAGKKITCFVDPDNPHQALLKRDMGWWAAWSLFPLPFAGVGLGGLWFTFRKKKKQALSASAKLREESNTSGYASPFRSSAARQEFSPGKKRFYWVLGAIAIAAFWNGIVSVFLFQVVESWKSGDKDWFLTLFLVPFLLIGIGLIVHILYRFFACFNPAPRLTLMPSEIKLGSAAQLKWSVPNGEQKLSHFAIYLVGEEEARYRRGTNTVTVNSIFCELPLIDTKDPRKVRAGAASVELPLDTLPSWKSTNNAIKWSLRVRGEISMWPDISDNYPITVIAPNNHE